MDREGEQSLPTSSDQQETEKDKPPTQQPLSNAARVASINLAKSRLVYAQILKRMADTCYNISLLLMKLVQIEHLHIATLNHYSLDELSLSSNLSYNEALGELTAAMRGEICEEKLTNDEVIVRYECKKLRIAKMFLGIVNLQYQACFDCNSFEDLETCPLCHATPRVTHELNCPMAALSQCFIDLLLHQLHLQRSSYLDKTYIIEPGQQILLKSVKPHTMKAPGSSSTMAQPATILSDEKLAEAMQQLSCEPSRSIPQTTPVHRLSAEHFLPHWPKFPGDSMHPRMSPGSAPQRANFVSQLVPTSKKRKSSTDSSSSVSVHNWAMTSSSEQSSDSAAGGGDAIWIHTDLNSMWSRSGS